MWFHGRILAQHTKSPRFDPKVGTPGHAWGLWEGERLGTKEERVDGTGSCLKGGKKNKVRLWDNVGM